jgi:aminoglycoside phosphotransferase (APT) family kinase protein
MDFMQSAVTNFSDLVTTLQLTGRAGEGEHVRQLAGGVSALVGVVEGGHEPWVIKAPLGQLSVDDEWLADRSRGANEAAILAQLDGQLGPIRTPRLLFYDDDNVLFGEEFIAPPTLNYKDELLAGRGHAQRATALGIALATLHRIDPPSVLDGPGPRDLFEALRLDPYYRVTAERRPELRDGLLALVEETVNVARPTLVHGDLSPKNVLVTPTSLVLLDWEVIHVGDPAFDRGMMGAHFLLKAIYHGPGRAAMVVKAARNFWSAYEGPADEERSIRHLGAVVVARLYGKSRVDYLVDETSRQRAHRIGAAALGGHVRTVEGLFTLLDDEGGPRRTPFRT